jgi:phytol kinase
MIIDLEQRIMNHSALSSSTPPTQHSALSNYPLLGMLLVMGVIVGLMVCLRAYRRRHAPHPELVRKLFHVGTGLFTLTLPWLFVDAWPVLVLSAVTVLALFALRHLRLLKSSLGGIIDGVERESLGEIYFAFSVGLLFYLAAGNALLFVVPLLVLTLADAVAALIGIRYGQVRFTATDGLKSAEGCVAFFTLAFFSVHVPLLLLSDTGRAESLLIAVMIGAMVMIAEVIAWRGLDNLFIPLFSFMLLKAYLPMTVEALVGRLVVAGALAIFVVLYKRRTTVTGAGLFAGVLVGYVCYALGGPRWVLAPVALFATYTLLSPRTDANSRRIHNVDAVLSVCSGGLLWLFLASELSRPDLFLPYTVAFAGHLAIVGVARLKFDYPRMSNATLLATCTFKGWLLILVPYVLLEGASWETMGRALVALSGVAVAAGLFLALQPCIHDCPTNGPRWIRQAACALVGSLVGLAAISY